MGAVLNAIGTANSAKAIRTIAHNAGSMRGYCQADASARVGLHMLMENANAVETLFLLEQVSASNATVSCQDVWTVSRLNNAKHVYLDINLSMVGANVFHRN